MKKSLLLSFAILMGALVVGVPSASAFELNRQEADSVCAAMGTIWGSQIKKKIAGEDPEKAKEYLRGIEDALKLIGNNDAYLEGLKQAVLIDSRIGQVEKMGGFDVSRERFAYYLLRASEGKRSGYSPSTAEDFMNGLMTRIAAETQRLEADKRYLASEAARKGVEKMSSGLLFEVLEEGEGDETPGSEAKLLIRYTGAFVDGKVFNEAGEGKVFSVSELIPGFREGAMKMKRKGRYRLVIPAEIGYGSAGVMGVIPPDAATVFTVELLDFNNPPKTN